jgi:hypothetical protein
MAVSRAEKTTEQAALETLFKAADTAVLVDYKGVTVPQVTELRRQIRAAGRELPRREEHARQARDHGHQARGRERALQGHHGRRVDRNGSGRDCQGPDDVHQGHAGHDHQGGGGAGQGRGADRR